MTDEWIRLDAPPMPEEGEEVLVRIIDRFRGDRIEAEIKAIWEGGKFLVRNKMRQTEYYLPAHKGGSVVAWRRKR